MWFGCGSPYIYRRVFALTFGSTRSLIRVCYWWDVICMYDQSLCVYIYIYICMLALAIPFDGVTWDSVLITRTGPRKGWYVVIYPTKYTSHNISLPHTYVSSLLKTMAYKVSYNHLHNMFLPQIYTIYGRNSIWIKCYMECPGRLKKIGHLGLD